MCNTVTQLVSLNAKVAAAMHCYSSLVPSTHQIENMSAADSAHSVKRTNLTREKLEHRSAVMYLSRFYGDIACSQRRQAVLPALPGPEDQASALSTLPQFVGHQQTRWNGRTIWQKDWHDRQRREAALSQTQACSACIILVYHSTPIVTPV